MENTVRNREREKGVCERERESAREREQRNFFFSVMMDWKVADVRLAKKF